MPVIHDPRPGSIRSLARAFSFALLLGSILFSSAFAQESPRSDEALRVAREASDRKDFGYAASTLRRPLKPDPEHQEMLSPLGLGLATVARWRSAPTASDAFTDRAATRGADQEGIQEERGAVRTALRPSAGPGWTYTRERQITSDTTAFRLETVGEFVDGRATLGRSVGVAGRVSRLHHWEKSPGLPTDTTLNYDLRGTALRGDLSFLRGYPLQATAGVSYEKLEARNPLVLYPLGSDESFFGFNAR